MYLFKPSKNKNEEYIGTRYGQLEPCWNSLLLCLNKAAASLSKQNRNKFWQQFNFECTCQEASHKLGSPGRLSPGFLLYFASPIWQAVCLGRTCFTCSGNMQSLPLKFAHNFQEVMSPIPSETLSNHFLMDCSWKFYISENIPHEIINYWSVPLCFAHIIKSFWL